MLAESGDGIGRAAERWGRRTRQQQLGAQGSARGIGRDPSPPVSRHSAHRGRQIRERPPAGQSDNFCDSDQNTEIDASRPSRECRGLIASGVTGYRWCSAAQQAAVSRCCEGDRKSMSHRSHGIAAWRSQLCWRVTNSSTVLVKMSGETVKIAAPITANNTTTLRWSGKFFNERIVRPLMKSNIDQSRGRLIHNYYLYFVFL